MQTESKIKRRLSKKQLMALGYLHPSSLSKYVFYGGAAGGGKSWLGCYCLMSLARRYPGTRWFIGRDSLKDTRESVLITFGKVAKEYDFTGYHYSDNTINFANGSVIIFLDLSFYPQKDPMFERLGSKEYTGGWIEEAGEVHFAAFDTLKSRVGRHMNDVYGIKAKILITANPKKNWLYTYFWQPYKTNKLPDDYAFIRAVYADNPDLPEDYIENLKQLSDPIKRARLIDGNFDYDDNPNCLIDGKALLGMFDGNVGKRGNRYITADIARYGSDKAVIIVWDGWVILEIVTFDISSTTDIQQCITALRYKYNIPLDRIVADEDGVGGGVVDNLGIKGFVNGSTPMVDPEANVVWREQYMNLQSQCGYRLARHANNRDILFACDVSESDREIIVTELEQLQTYKSDEDGKLRIKPKAAIKEEIGRSPDYRDALLMRSYFDYDDYVPQDNAADYFAH